jgi:hypothetical protein
MDQVFIKDVIVDQTSAFDRNRKWLILQCDCQGSFRASAYARRWRAISTSGKTDRLKPDRPLARAWAPLNAKEAVPGVSVV